MEQVTDNVVEVVRPKIRSTIQEVYSQSSHTGKKFKILYKRKTPLSLFYRVRMEDKTEKDMFPCEVFENVKSTKLV